MLYCAKATMAEFLTLTCPSCGGKLSVSNSVNQFVCAHCGNEHIVKREGGTVWLDPLVKGIEDIRIGTNKTASELAIKRLQEEIKDLVDSLDYFLQNNWKLQGFRDSFIGPKLEVGQWFFTAAYETIQKSGKSPSWGYDPSLVKQMSVVEIKESMGNIERLKLKEIDKKAVAEFAEKIITFRTELETKRRELEKHREIVKS